MPELTKTDLENMIKGVVAQEIAPLLETQRKYAPMFESQSPAPTTKGEKLEPGIRMARYAKCLTLAKNDPEKALHFAQGKETSKGMYPNDTELHAAFKALSVTNPSEGGYTVPEELVNEIIPLLYSQTAVMELGARRLPMPNGNLNLPRMAGGATAYYQGENKPATKSQPSFDNLKLSSKKLFTVVPMSNDLIRNSSIAADMYVRDDMIRQMAIKIDNTAFLGAGTQYSPMGLINYPGIDKATIGSIIGADDPGIMLGNLMSKNLPMASVGWAFNGDIWRVLYNLKTTTGAYIYRDEMNTGKLLGHPFKIVNHLPSTGNNKATPIFLGDYSEFIFGEEIAFEMTASNEATYTDENGNLVSAFTNDQTILKVLSKHDMQLRHKEAYVIRTYNTL